MASAEYVQLGKLADEQAQAALVSESQASTSASLTSLQKTFPLYVQAAQSYSQLLAHHELPQAQRPTVVKRWKMVLDRAYKIKKVIESRGGAVGRVAAGEEGRQAEIRRKGGFVNGVLLHSWTGNVKGPDTSGLLEDPRPPALSPAQLALAPEWRRADWSQACDKGKRPATSHDIEVEQGPGADCSVVASLAVCLGHNLRFQSSLGQNSLYPPTSSPSGRHEVKLFFNGAERQIDIDDRLPYSRDRNHALHAIAKVGGLDVPWIGLLEKAYMKVMGGYDFPGSNPSADLYAITGWIPQRISTKESRFQREKTWSKLVKGFEAGHCLVTLGTGTEASDGLIPLHAYGVLNVKENDGQRFLKIINPWQRRQRDSPGKERADPLASQLASMDIASDLPQVFEKPWDEVCQCFETVEINWKPLEGIKTAVAHWMWQKPASGSATDNAVTFSRNPRYRISTHSQGRGSEVWILLSQHITHKDRKGDAIALHVFEEHAVSSVLAPSRAAFSGSYSNGLHVLLRFRLLPGDNELLVVPARDGGAFDTGFTIQAFAQEPVGLERIVRNLQYSEEVKGSITTRSAGGNPAHPTHMNNPQYRLELKSARLNSLPNEGAVRVSVLGDKTLAWNVKLVFGAGKRIDDIVEGDVLLDSGSYTFSMAVAESTSLQSGVYTLVVSLFEPGWTGDFSLLVESSMALSLTPIAQEGAGLFQRSLNGSWNLGTAGGRPSGGKYDSNPKIEVIVASNCSVQGRLMSPTPCDTPINLTLFRRANGGALGVKLLKIKLDPGIYILVPSTYQFNTHASWSLSIWSDKPVELVKT